MSSIILEPIALLLLVACLIAIGTRRLGLPYISGLVVAGFLIALIPDSPALPLSRDLIFNILLPPLIFQGALQLDWKSFRGELPLTLALAFGGVIIAAAVVAAGMHWIVGWSWIGAGLFGALIAATDPVSVIASFRHMNCRSRVSIVVESESLLNDGVAAVAFAILSAIAVGGSGPDIGSIAPVFLWTLGGGILIGTAVSAFVLIVVGRTNDPLVEIALTTIAAYGSFWIADYLHASGIISALCSGLIIGGIGQAHFLSEQGRDRLGHAWEFFVFLANSFVFMLIGINLSAQSLQALGPFVAGSAILLVLVARAASIYPLALLFGRSRWHLPAAYRHILFWGGLRGALALALALTLPTAVPERGAIIAAAFVVVAFSILIQGTTMPWLVKHWDLASSASSTARP